MIERDKNVKPQSLNLVLSHVVQGIYHLIGVIRARCVKIHQILIFFFLFSLHFDHLVFLNLISCFCGDRARISDP